MPFWVGRLCQWIFPIPTHPSTIMISAVTVPAVSVPAAHYYQVVISASRSLPKGDTDTVRKLIEADIKEIFPEAADSQLLRIRTVTDPQAVLLRYARFCATAPTGRQSNGQSVCGQAIGPTRFGGDDGRRDPQRFGGESPIAATGDICTAIVPKLHHRLLHNLAVCTIARLPKKFSLTGRCDILSCFFRLKAQRRATLLKRDDGFGIRLPKDRHEPDMPLERPT